MERLKKILFVYLILTLAAAQFSVAGETTPHDNIEALECSVRTGGWYKGRMSNVIDTHTEKIAQLETSKDKSDLQQIMWFPEEIDQSLKGLGVFASLIMNLDTGNKEVEVGFYRDKVFMPDEQPPENSLRIPNTKFRYMVPVLTKTIDDLKEISISYEDDVLPTAPKITRNTNRNYIDLSCDYLGSFDTNNY